MIFDRRRIPADASITMTPGRDGWPLRTYFQPARGTVCGSILWLGGRGDIFEKYLESFDAWTQAGRSVTSFDWRGQGGSGRLGINPRIGHVDDFATWIDDLAAFYDDWRLRTPGPHFVFGHSMGGHLLLRALSERCIDPVAAVLSAPMLGFESGPIPFAMAAAMARLLARVTTSRNAAWKSNEKPSLPGASRQDYLTHDPDRYADELWWKQQNPELVLGPPSWSWLAAAFRSIAGLRQPDAVEHIAVPILILGTDGDQLVSPSAIRAFAARLTDAKLVMLGKDAAHEILRERDGPRNCMLAAIAEFLDGRT
ncbi:alpha/beta fold hydrolase [Sphingomonas sp.]|uniref:alpha/beta fold hydrolase n=1 Tax=Sphingomonas sp. TaxID=28214 RepID=UPI0025F008A5|nr:alpha/beta hydrolase [Sphingomonas sp.]